MDRVRVPRAARLAPVAALGICCLSLVLLAGLVRALPPTTAAAIRAPACVGNLLGQLRSAEAWAWTLCHDQGPVCEWQLARQHAVLVFQLTVACAL